MNYTNIDDLCKQSIKAHLIFVTRRIENQKNLIAYSERMNQILGLFKYKNSWEVREYIMFNIKDKIDPWYSISSFPQSYKSKATSHAYEIIDNLYTRFNKGWSKSYIK
jgi:hypothetical protein